MNILAQDKTIEQIFSPSNVYKIPRNQREYAWEQDELIELWDDVIRNINIENDVFVNSEYFIGSLVLCGKDTEYSIVDGQQRLTTITILLSALVETFKLNGETDLSQGLYSYVEGKNKKNEKIFKLVNEELNPMLQNAIQNYDKTTYPLENDQQDRAHIAYEFFLKKLSDLRKEHKGNEKYIEYLEAIRDQILQLKTIFITVDDQEDAYTIFETLNSRGKDLDFIDLIKNTSFQVLNKTHPSDHAKEKWSKLLENLSSRKDRINIKVFFRHYWLSKYEFSTEAKIYDSFKKSIATNDVGITEFLNNLIYESNHYNLITNPLNADWKQQEEKDIYKSLEALNLFKVTQVRTLLLAVLDRRKNKKIDLTDFVSFMKAIENFHFIFSAVCSSSASGLERKYSRVARDIRNSNNKSDIRKMLNELKADFRQKIPSSTVFREKFKGLWYSDEVTKDKRLIQYIFRKWEEHLMDTEELEISRITIEHIAPQSETSLSSIVGSIGNLLPLDRKLNNVASSKGFAHKVEYFKKSNLNVVFEFVNGYGSKTSWGEKEIVERTEEIAKLAYDKIWKIV